MWVFLFADGVANYGEGISFILPLRPETLGVDSMGPTRSLGVDSMGPITTHELTYDCVVISDLHLGSEVCQARLLEEFLEWAVGQTRVLVINGDIFDDLNFKRLNKRHFACLRIIRRNSDRDDFKLVWVRGNHDGPAEIVSHIVGVEILDEYVFQNDQIRVLILHGDQFDRIVTEHIFVTNAAVWFYAWIQKLMPHRTSRWIRLIAKRFQRNSRVVMEKAVEYARSKGFKYVTCGHTHLALEQDIQGIHYINSGTWTEAAPCPFVAIKGNSVHLEYWPKFAPIEESVLEPHPVALPLPALGSMT